MGRGPQPEPDIRIARRLRVLALAVLLIGPQLGCIRTLVMVGKVLMGDPIQKSGFEMATGVSLEKSQKRILVHCSSLAFIAAENGTLTIDIQEELMRRMKRHRLDVLPSTACAKVLDRLGGTFDPQALAREIADVDYIIQIQIDKYRDREEASPNLYRGHVSGRIVGYEARGEGSSRHAVEIFNQQFQAMYPTTYPISVDQMPQNIFNRRFVEHVADSLGASFYDVSRSDLYAN